MHLLHPSPNNVIAPHLTIRGMSFDKTSRTFSVDASQLSPQTSGHFMGQLYNDAADVGLALDNPHTNRSVPFFLKNVDEREGDVMGWWFEVLPESARKHPELTGLKLLIVNT